MGKCAIILGASGLTGGLLLDKLISSPDFDKIKLFARQSININSSKVDQHIGDLLNLEEFASIFTGDVVFCCIGTTASKTKDKSIYKDIDFGIPVSAAKLAKKNNIPTFMVISALGANANSGMFYNRTKGEMENAVINKKIENTFLLRPSLIVGDRKEYRLGEKIGSIVFKFLHPLMLGRLRKYRFIEAQTIAQTMVSLVQSNEKLAIIESDRIQEISDKGI